MVFVNAKIREPRDGPESFDIVAFAEKYFDTSQKLLIVREKAVAWHWHVNGTLKNSVGIPTELNERSDN